MMTAELHWANIHPGIKEIFIQVSLVEYLLWALCYAGFITTEMYKATVRSAEAEYFYILCIHICPFWFFHRLKASRIWHFKGQGSASKVLWILFLSERTMWERMTKGWQLISDHDCHRMGRRRTFPRCFTPDQDEVWSQQTFFAVSWALLCLPVAVQGEGCSQGIVHSRSGAQVGCREQPQQQHTDSSLPCPVQGCSPGTACKEKHSQGAAPLPRAEICSVCEPKPSTSNAWKRNGSISQAETIKNWPKLSEQHPQSAQLTHRSHPSI